jgi:hypothetical protein
MQAFIAPQIVQAIRECLNEAITLIATERIIIFIEDHSSFFMVFGADQHIILYLNGIDVFDAISNELDWVVLIEVSDARVQVDNLIGTL